VAEQLDEANIYVWDGNYYTLEMTKRLGLEDSDGMVRVGPVHYNQAPGFWVRSPRTLGNAGGDPVVRGGVEEACLRVYLITGKAIVSYRKSSLIHGLTGQNRNRRIQGSRSHIEIY
jgi:hypothetical protein